MRRPANLALALAFALAASPLARAQDTAPASAPVPAPAPAPAPAGNVPPLPSVQTVLDKVQAFYNQTATFKSPFKQTFLVKAYNVTKNSVGEVTFQKPGKMNWTYSEPVGNRVVSDGTTVRVFEAANKQLYEQPMSGTEYPGALSFLTGQGQLSTSFDFELRDGAGPMGFPGGYVLIGTPKTPTPAYQKVLFYVDSGTMQIRRVLILDGQGNRNRFDFLAPVVNQPVNANEFVFVAPPGTTVIHP